MKRISIIIWAFLACTVSNAQLVIYSGLNQQGSSGTCVARTVYTDATIPNTLNNRIRSITLSKGYMAVLAENTDGSGEGFNYIASASNVNVNLAGVLQNRVSFIRVLPIMANLKKKGAGSNDATNLTADLLEASWLYDWGPNDVSTTTREFVPMAWGRGAATSTNVGNVIAKTDVTCYLAFNEPDNADQSNIPFADAVPLYKNMLRSGMRMGTPAPTENEYRIWLQDFTDLAEQQNLRIDFVAVHWYDWGNWTSANPDNSATNIFNRFKSYIGAVYTRYGKPIWITEFNANRNRTTAVQEAFMRLALPWLETNNRVERYAYFFPPAVPAILNGALTTAGQVYSDHVSTNAYPANVVDTRSTVLPITLSDFQSNKVKDTVYLKWETKSEINFSHFALERSTDGKTFYDIAKVNASKNANGSTYAYSDTPNGATTNYYRLKMVDNDGSFEYSKILSEGFDGSKTPLLVYPSIATGNKIEATFDKVSEAALMQIFNITGQLISTDSLKGGTSAKTIDITTYTEGSYFLILQDKGTTQSRKFIKQ